MSPNKLASIVLVTLCISAHCYADNRGYLKLIFSSKDAVPATQIIAARAQQVSTRYQLTFTDSNLNKVFASYTIMDFEKEYPIADSFPDDQAPAAHLRLVYKVIIDTTTGKSYDGLKKSTDSVSSSLITATVRALPFVLLTAPNDYTDLTGVIPSVASQLNFINALGAWNVTTGLSCVKIGIVELGDNTFQKHADFINTNGTSKIVVSSNSVDPPDAFNLTAANCPTTPNYYYVNPGLCYHGESVAGLAGAATNNNLGVASLGYNVSVQFYLNAYTGITNAIYDKCKVINCSWGSSYQSIHAPSLDEQYALDLAALNNVTIVAAAGNGGSNSSIQSYYTYPASFDNVISVTSVGNYNDVGSSIGANWKDCHREFFDPSLGDTSFTHTHNDKVDLCVPGYYVQVIGADNKYSSWGGTSYASPQVAAAAALLYSVNPFFTPAQIRNYLYQYGANIDNACVINGVSDNQRWAGKIGHRLDAGASLQAAATNTYNGPVYCSGNGVNCPTTSTSITTNTILSQSKYFYNYDIIAGTNGSDYVQTSTTAQTAFIAVNSITLQAGFDANPSSSVNSDGTYAYFTAYIEPCFSSVSSREAAPTKKALSTDNSSKGLQLYPNPATNEVHIFFTITKDQKATIKVVNNLGVIVKIKSVVSSKDGSGNTDFDIKDLPAGVYYVSLTSAGNTMTKKLVKTNQY